MYGVLILNIYTNIPVLAQKLLEGQTSPWIESLGGQQTEEKFTFGMYHFIFFIFTAC